VVTRKSTVFWVVMLCSSQKGQVFLEVHTTYFCCVLLGLLFDPQDVYVLTEMLGFSNYKVSQFSCSFILYMNILLTELTYSTGTSRL
jgi:NADH:ubiquinone oxidoreductase subunit 3 (subunit A)